MKSSYYTVKKQSFSEIEVKKSRFLCDIKSIINEDQAKDFIKQIKAKYPDARHVCYAFICDVDGNNFKYSDGGEPQGTAGLPILEALKTRNLTCVVAVVTRYFGGILLGTGGLARAYSDSTVSGINTSTVSEYLSSIKLKVQFSYSLYPKFTNKISSYNVIINNNEYLDNGVQVTFTCPTNEKDKIINLICELSAGKSHVEEIERLYQTYEK